MMNRERVIIAGPCAAESRRQVLECANALEERGIDKMRASLWKPRTKPGFDGVGLEGSPWVAEVTRMGITIGTEVLLPSQVSELMKAVDYHGGDPTKVLFWLGSRNQNHLVQREIARRIHNETPESVKLVIKNQPWADQRHWEGIVAHILSTNMEPRRLILCHRGFSPYKQRNSENYRNLPDWDMAMKVRELTNIPMVLDPSHIGGTVENVFRTVGIARRYDFDGLMVEVCPNPPKARTDAGQQLTFEEFDKLLIFYGGYE